MTKTRIGMIGTGWIAQAHRDALLRVADVEIRAIAGRNTERAKELAGETGARVYGHWREMLDAEQLDVAVILLPPHLHGELEEACAGRVRGVLVEKPIAVDYPTAERAQAAFERAGTITAVSYQNRYRSSVQVARQHFASDDQPIILVNGWWQSPMPGSRWWRTKAQSGGQFVEQTTHVVDLARYIAGEIVEVSAFAARGLAGGPPEYDVDEAMVVNVRFASGAVGNFSTGCHVKGRSRIGLRFSTVDTEAVLSDGTFDLRIEQHQQPPIDRPSDGDPFALQAERFIRAVRENDPAPVLSDYSDALKTLRVTLAANESLVTGRPVEL